MTWCWSTPISMPPTMLMPVIIRPATASPRTNLDAPSMAPKKVLSCSRSLRRCLAPFSSISPDDRSASMAICLPGMASRVKRAATSAMRVEPLVMTTKFTKTRMAKTITPMTKLPAIISLPNAWIICPAGSPPSCPWLRIRRVEARLRPSRNRVVTSSTVGKAVNSSGFLISSDVIRISTAEVSDRASKRSIRIAGTGSTKSNTIPMDAQRQRHLPLTDKSPGAFERRHLEAGRGGEVSHGWGLLDQAAARQTPSFDKLRMRPDFKRSVGAG